jgi:hypothetical protein
MALIFVNLLSVYWSVFCLSYAPITTMVTLTLLLNIILIFFVIFMFQVIYYREDREELIKIQTQRHNALYQALRNTSISSDNIKEDKPKVAEEPIKKPEIPRPTTANAIQYMELSE